MLPWKASIPLAAYGSLASGTTVGTGSSTSWTKNRRDRVPRHRHRNRCANYATVCGDNTHHDELHQQEQHVWPKAPRGQAHPTPYQIFDMESPKAVYTKTRFYELVKLYHPDKNNGSPTSIPHAVKIERYRLIVNAHSILSDPIKRDAYDRFGAGWNGKAELGRRDTYHQQSPYGRPGPFSSSWGQPRDPIWQNATWEDWERYWAWKAKEAKGEDPASSKSEQSPLYLQNSYFVVFIIVLALAGSSANYNRARDAGTYVVAQRDIVHDQTAKDLRRARQEAAVGGRDQRIQWFLRNREATLGLTEGEMEALREEKAGRLLPEREVCSSEEVAQRDIPND